MKQDDDAGPWRGERGALGGAPLGSIQSTRGDLESGKGRMDREGKQTLNMINLPILNTRMIPGSNLTCSALICNTLEYFIHFTYTKTKATARGHPSPNGRMEVRHLFARVLISALRTRSILGTNLRKAPILPSDHDLEIDIPVSAALLRLMCQRSWMYLSGCLVLYKISHLNPA